MTISLYRYHNIDNITKNGSDLRVWYLIRGTIWYRHVRALLWDRPRKWVHVPRLSYVPILSRFKLFKRILISINPKF